MEPIRICSGVEGVNRKRCRTAVLGITFVLMLLLVLLVASYSYAAEPLTLEQAVSLALANNPGLRAADAQVKAADAGVLRSASGFLPKVDVTETWSRTDNPMMVLGTKLNQELVSPTDFDPRVMNDPDPISNYNTRVSVMQPLFNGGREYLGRTQAKLGQEATINQRERARQETAFSVVKAYYGLLLAQAHRGVALQSLQTSSANVKLAEARYRAGAVLQSDLLRAKVQYAEVRGMLTRAENAVRLAGAGLNFAMGVSQTNEYEIAGALTTQELDRDLTSALGEARSRRPDLAAMELNRRSTEQTVAMARSEYLPTLNVMGQVDWNSSKLAGDDGKSWAVMGILQWNLFDGLATRSRVKEAVAHSSRMRSLEEQTREGIELQVRQAYYSASASLDRIAATATSVQEAEEGLRIIQKRYETGMTNFVDLLGAESALIRARTNALQAVYDNNLAVAELKLATGTL
jgi:outer membrane protein TolC